MKTKSHLILATALILSACTTGKFVSTGFVDDIYFNPQDVPPPVMVEESPQNADNARAVSPGRVILSEITQNADSSQTLNNYIYDGRNADKYADAQRYNMEQMQLENSDTSVYYDDNEIKYVINNYYNGDDMDFSYRIHRFHRPYFYDPFYWNDWYWNDWGWDSWYDPYWSMSYGWGYSPWYGGMYGGMYGGYYGGMYGSWYSPYSYWGWGGGYGYPYNSYWGGGYYNNYGGGGYYSSEDYRYGKRRDYNTTVRSANGSGFAGSRNAATNNDRSALKNLNTSGTGNSLYDASGRGRSVSGVDGGGRPGRGTVNSTPDSQNSTITNLRRNGAVSNAPTSTSGTSRRYTGSQGQYTRPVTSGSGQMQGRTSNSYSPSYNQQRSATRSNFNVQSYDRPASGSGSQNESYKSAQRSTSVYSRPSSSSSSDRSYRSTSTYNSSSSSGVNSSRSYTPSSGSSNYSAPSRSYDSGSSGSYSSPSRSSSYSGSSGGSYSGGSSGGASTSGGGSSSGGGGSSSNSGRR